MSVIPQREMTTSEAAIVENFGQRLGDFPGDSSVMSSRDNVIEQFKTNGLPSRKQEYWHYTDLRTLLKTVPAFNVEGDGRAVEPLIAKSAVFAIFNGKTLNAPKIDNVSIDRYADALADDRCELRTAISDDDFIGQLNTAFVSDGWLLDVADGTSLEMPIELQIIQQGGQSHVYSQVNIGSESNVTIIERQLGNDEPALLSSVGKLKVGAGSHVAWIVVRDREFDSTQFAQFHSILAQGAKLTLYVVNIASQLNRQEIDVELQGEGSDFQLRTINLLAGNSHSDVTMTVRHVEENSTSTEIVRNVITDNARGAFQGMIRVAQKAQKTDARMACNSLILSDDAEFDAKPELEIFADDVACGHGATVAEIDHDHLFYLMARGIPLAAARGLLVKAFVSELIDDVENDSVRAALSKVIDGWLETHL